jgi:hypothetical protein
VDDEQGLQKLASQLTAQGTAFHLWMEHPEMVATCLATVPVPKSTTAKALRRLKLFQNPVGGVPPPDHAP